MAAAVSTSKYAHGALATTHEEEGPLFVVSRCCDESLERFFDCPGVAQNYTTE